jgi:hypothetical protein
MGWLSVPRLSTRPQGSDRTTRQLHQSAACWPTWRTVAQNRFNSGSSAEPLVITPGTNRFAVKFSALDYTAPERNRYAYRLDGFDTGWNASAALRRVAAYTNIPPGSYTLRLLGSNRDGVWTEKTLDLPIDIHPAWDQALWLKLLLVGAGIAAVATIVQTRTAYLRRRRRELESQVEVHTADVRRLAKRPSVCNARGMPLQISPAVRSNDSR